MDFEMPQALQGCLAELEKFSERAIKPLEESNNNVRLFDHRREYAGIDLDHDAVPRRAREDLCQGARHRADLIVPRRVVGKT